MLLSTKTRYKFFRKTSIDILLLNNIKLENEKKGLTENKDGVCYVQF